MESLINVESIHTPFLTKGIDVQPLFFSHEKNIIKNVINDIDDIFLLVLIF